MTDPQRQPIQIRESRASRRFMFCRGTDNDRFFRPTAEPLPDARRRAPGKMRRPASVAAVVELPSRQRLSPRHTANATQMSLFRSSGRLCPVFHNPFVSWLSTNHSTPREVSGSSVTKPNRVSESRAESRSHAERSGRDRPAAIVLARGEEPPEGLLDLRAARVSGHDQQLDDGR
jgi:hypothetical protein